jgi:2-polyprenyl-3-methyl-5-hydroxy-6-metoxy-1,4-benzoquinol methylase
MFVHEKNTQFEVDQRKFFDELITKDWNTYKNKLWDFTRAYEVKKIIQKTNPSRILDIGCGCGFHDLLFAKSSGVKYVLGIDYSKESIKKANQEYPHQKVERVCIDFLSESEGILSDFDLAVSFQVIEHLEDFERFLSLMSSKVKKGGYVAIATPNFDRFSNRIRRFFGYSSQFCDPMHFREFNLLELKNLGKNAHLNMIDHFGYALSLNAFFNFDKYIPAKVRFYLGAAVPSMAEVIVIIFKKL